MPARRTNEQEKRKGSNASVHRPPQRTTFIDRPLSIDEKSACKGWEAWQQDFAGLIDSICESGHSISIKFDAYNKCWAAYAFPAPENSEHAGLALVGRGSAPQKAIKQLMFIHFVLFDAIWPNLEIRQGPEDFDD